MTPDSPEQSPVTPDRTIAKEIWKPSTQLCPVPAVLISTRDVDGRANLATVAWAGTVCSTPPMLSISLRPATLTHEIITRTGEFVVNVPSVHEVKAVDYCGVVSGRDIDKFKMSKLTPADASQVKAPLVAECPLNIECRVTQTLDLGSHTMFIADVLAVHASKHLMTGEGRMAVEKAGLVAYAHGHYFALGKQLGNFGYSVRKKKPETVHRRRRKNSR